MRQRVLALGPARSPSFAKVGLRIGLSGVVSSIGDAHNGGASI